MIKVTNNGGSSTAVTLTTSRSIQSSDNAATLVYSGASDVTLTFVSGMPSGFSFTVIQAGSGKVIAGQGAGVGFNNTGGTLGVNTFFTVVMGTQDQFTFQNPVPVGAVPVLQGAVPFILVPSGTMGNNGALTLGTALNTTYPNAYCYFPADVIAVGVAAGWYYTVFSSTTVGTVYNNRYTTGTASVPTSTTAFSTTGVGAYTQTVATDAVGPTTTVLAGAIGKNGCVEHKYLFLSNNTAGSKTCKATLGIANVFSSALSSSTIVSDGWSRSDNCGVYQRQVVRSSVAFGNGTTAPQFNAVDTSVDQTVGFALQIATATDYLILLRHSVELTRV